MSPNNERGIIITGMLEEHVPAVFLLDQGQFFAAMDRTVLYL